MKKIYLSIILCLILIIGRSGYANDKITEDNSSALTIPVALAAPAVYELMLGVLVAGVSYFATKIEAPQIEGLNFSGIASSYVQGQQEVSLEGAIEQMADTQLLNAYNAIKIEMEFTGVGGQISMQAAKSFFEVYNNTCSLDIDHLQCTVSAVLGKQLVQGFGFELEAQSVVKSTVFEANVDGDLMDLRLSSTQYLKDMRKKPGCQLGAAKAVEVCTFPWFKSPQIESIGKDKMKYICNALGLAFATACKGTVDTSDVATFFNHNPAFYFLTPAIACEKGFTACGLAGATMAAGTYALTDKLRSLDGSTLVAASCEEAQATCNSFSANRKF